MDQNMKSIKIVVIGDGSVGKTCLLATYTTNTFPKEYIPTVYENHSVIINVEEQTIKLELWDTAGQEDYKNLRPISYPNTDVFLICFSLVSPSSLDNIDKVWIPEIKEHNPDTPYILVGLKSDMRDNDDVHSDDASETEFEPIQTEIGEKMKNQIGAAEYIECSAANKYNIKEVFETAVKVTLKSQEQQKRKICYLI